MTNLLPEGVGETLTEAAADTPRSARHAELHRGEGVKYPSGTKRTAAGAVLHPVAGRRRREGGQRAVAGERLGEVHRDARVEGGIGGAGRRRDRGDRQRRWREPWSSCDCPACPNRCLDSSPVWARCRADQGPGRSEGDDQDQTLVTSPGRASARLGQRLLCASSTPIRGSPPSSHAGPGQL